MTTNLEPSEWVSVFGDAKMITVLHDRVTHHYSIIETKIDSIYLKKANKRL